MKKERKKEIVEVQINHPEKGIMIKKNLIVYEKQKDGSWIEIMREYYDGDLPTGPYIEKTDASKIDIDSLSDEQLLKLANRIEEIKNRF